LHNIKPGNILLAEPFMSDMNFERSVILVCEHSEDTSFGFIMNYVSDHQIGSVIVDLAEIDIPLYIGGPVEQNTLHYIHRAGDNVPGSIKIKDELYWSGDFDFIKEGLINKTLNPKDFKFFVGYSGWGKDQLAIEFKKNTWLSFELDMGILFDCPANEMWKEILKRQGGKYREMANYPKDPRLN